MIHDGDIEKFRIDHNPPKKLEKFVDEVQRVRQIVTSEFKAVRPDADTVNPPVAIFSDSALDGMVKPAVPIPKSGPILAAYDPLRDEIDVSEQFAKGTHHQARTLILAEELIHAQTTRDFGEKVRVAFTTFPHSRYTNELKSGGIYDLKSYQAETADRAVKGDPDKILLLERATLFAVHSMLSSLLRRDFPLLCLLRQGQIEAYFMNQRQLLTDVLGSMYEGNPNLLPKDLLRIFKDPRPLDWASSPRNNDKGKNRNLVMMRL